MKEVPTTVGKLAEVFSKESAAQLPHAKSHLRRNFTGRFLVTKGSENVEIGYDVIRDVYAGALGPSENPAWSEVAAPELTRLGTIAYKYGTEPLKMLRDAGAKLYPRELAEEAKVLNYYDRRKAIGQFNAEVRSGQREVTVYEAEE